MIRLGPEQRVLVRLPSWLGDFVMAEPLVRALAAQRAGREARISLAAPGRFFDLWHSRFDGSLRLPLEDAARGASDPWRGHDVVLLLDGSLRSAWRALRAGIPARVGWARGGRAPLLTHGLRPALERGARPLGIGRVGRWPRYVPRPFSSVCHELASLLGLQLHDVRPRLAPNDAARAKVRARVVAAGVDPDEPWLLVNAGARSGSAKGYGASRWGEVLARLAAAGGPPGFVVCGPGEEGDVRAALAAAGGGPFHGLLEPVPDLAELAAWCAGAVLVVTADGGLRHVAGAVGTPRVVLFGPTDPRHTADVWEDEEHLRREVECGPCHRELCPIVGAGRERCMAELAPDRIAQLVGVCLARVSQQRSEFSGTGPRRAR